MNRRRKESNIEPPERIWTDRADLLYDQGLITAGEATKMSGHLAVRHEAEIIEEPEQAESEPRLYGRAAEKADRRPDLKPSLPKLPNRDLPEDAPELPPYRPPEILRGDPEEAVKPFE